MYTTIFLIVVLVIYWIILFLNYDYDKNLPIVYDNEIMDSINPIVAGLVIDNRNIYVTDIIATILNLVKKDILTITNIKKDDVYINIIKLKNESNIESLDEIEKCIFKIVFEDEKEVDINERICNLVNNKKISLNLKKVDILVKKKLDKIGANAITVPAFLKFTNHIIALITIMYISMNICFNSKVVQYFLIDILNIGNNLAITGTVIGILIICLSVILYLISIFMRETFKLRNTIYSAIMNISDRKIVLVTLTNAILSIGIFLCISVILNVNAILEFGLFFITINIISTDEIMSKHKKSVVKLYCQLNTLKDKIKDSSFFEENDHLLQNYLIFAIVFMLNKKNILNLSKKIGKNEYLNIISNLYNNNEIFKIK